MFYMCICVILAVLYLSFTCVKVLYWLFFPLVLHVHRCYIDFFLLVLHVYMCNISCSSFYLYMCIGVILTVLPFNFTCV